MRRDLHVGVAARFSMTTSWNPAGAIPKSGINKRSSLADCPGNMHVNGLVISKARRPNTSGEIDSPSGPIGHHHGICAYCTDCSHKPNRRTIRWSVHHVPSKSTVEMLNTNTSAMCTPSIHVEETEYRSRTHTTNPKEKRAVQTSASSQMPAMLQYQTYIGSVLVS